MMWRLWAMNRVRVDRWHPRVVDNHMERLVVMAIPDIVAKWQYKRGFGYQSIAYDSRVRKSKIYFS